MKITRRIHDAIVQFRADKGLWPNCVYVGHKEVEELHGAYDLVPEAFTYGYLTDTQVTVSVRQIDEPSELLCSIITNKENAP